MIINFNNIGSVTGGGGTPSPSSSNYMVVDALSAITNPTEGLMAYVKAKTKVTNGVRFEISNWENFSKNGEGNAEDFLARVHWGDWDKNEYSEFGEDLLAANIYLSGNQFYWGWNNDGNLNYMESERDGAYYKIMYQIHSGEESGYGSYFDFYPLDETPWGDYKFAIWDNCSTSVTQNTAIIPGRTYVYSAGQWVEIASTTFVWEDIAPSTTAETAALLEKIRSSIARGIYPSILYQNHICNYSGGNSQWVNFEGVFGYNRDITFYISDQIFDQNGFNKVGIRLEDKQFLYDYNLPVASANELGGVKIGQGISIDQDGVISAQGGKNDIVIDVAEVDNMSYADREVLWDEVYEKILAGHKIYAKGEIWNELGYYAYLPLEKYKAKTNTSTHIGGFLSFEVKDSDANTYLHFVFTSAGNLSGLYRSKLEKYDIYSLPIARSNTLGGVKIGSGISIDEDGVISVQGGGSGGYNIVSSLPETGSATEGALYYVKPYVESVEYRGISISTTSSEGDVAYIHNGKGKQYRVYISGTNFHWGWNNDGEYHKFNNADFWYKTDNANKTFNAYFPDNTWTVTLGEGATSAETSPYTAQISHDGTTYRFNGTGYTIDGGNDNIFYFGNDNFSRLMNLKENGVDLSQLTYVYNERQYALFNNYDSANNKFIFKI